MEGVAVDGNDVLAVYEAARQAIARARAGDGPTLIEAKTYRVVGHHEGDPLTGTYRTQEELDAWRTRCPIAVARCAEQDPALARQGSALAERWLGDRKGLEPDLVPGALHTFASRGDRARFRHGRCARDALRPAG